MKKKLDKVAPDAKTVAAPAPPPAAAAPVAPAANKMGKKPEVTEEAKAKIFELLDTLQKSKDDPKTSKKTLNSVAKKKNKLVTLDDVEAYCMTEPIHQIKDMKGYSSWLGSMARVQYHLDIPYVTNAKTK